MSRRLGDDPLTRARGERIKAVEGSAPVAVVSAGQEGVGQVGIQTTSRSSYNDVFFQRRGEGVAPQQAAADALGAPEVPEISEISEIPEIRDAAAASGSLATFDVTTDAIQTSSAPEEAHVVQAPTVSIIEEVVARLNAAGAGPASMAATPQQAKEEPTAPLASQAPVNGGAEPQKGGFFKRLFGKFK